MKNMTNPASWIIAMTAHLGIKSMEDIRNATGELKEKIDEIKHQECVRMVKEDEKKTEKERADETALLERLGLLPKEGMTKSEFEHFKAGVVIGYAFSMGLENPQEIDNLSKAKWKHFEQQVYRAIYVFGLGIRTQKDWDKFSDENPLLKLR